MTTAQITVLVLLTISLLSLVFYYFLRVRTYINSLNFNFAHTNFEKSIYFEIAKRLDSGFTLNSALSILFESLPTIVNYTQACFLVKSHKSFDFLSYNQQQLGFEYVKTARSYIFDKYIKESSDVTSFKSLDVKEYLSGPALNNNISIQPKSFLSVPIYYKKMLLGFVVITHKDKDFFEQSPDSVFIKTAIKNVLDFIFEIQEMTKSGKAKEEYTNMMVHDLRTPLTIILGSSDMLLKRQKDLSKQKQNEIVKDIKSATKRLLNIVDNLLDIAKFESGKFKFSKREVNLAAHLQGLNRQYKSFVESRGLNYKTKFTKQKLVCNIDTHFLERVLDNLVSNATKYTKKGSVTIKLSKLKGKNMAKISVADTGVGIDKSKQKHLFSKYEQIISPVDDSQKSTGLGLVVSKKIVKALGGNIGFKSKVGKGSEFYFTLPLLKN